MHFSGPYQAPSDVRLQAIDTNLNQVEFAWNSVPRYCPSIRYTVSTDCGICPNITSDTSIVCQLLSKISTNSSRECMFAVGTKVCGHILGEMSDNATVHLSGKQCIMKILRDSLEKRALTIDEVTRGTRRW